MNRNIAIHLKTLSDLKGKPVIEITKGVSIPIGKPVSMKRLFSVGPFTIWWTRRPEKPEVSETQFVSRLASSASRVVQTGRSIGLLIVETIVERVFPTVARLAGWSARGASRSVELMRLTVRFTVTTVVERFFPPAERFVGRLSRGASRSVRTMRSTGRLVVKAIIAWFFQFWLMLGLMGNAFFALHNLVPMLAIAGLITVFFIWISRPKQRAQ